jgi:hypothetical protein
MRKSVLLILLMFVNLARAEPLTVVCSDGSWVSVLIEILGIERAEVVDLVKEVSSSFGTEHGQILFCSQDGTASDFLMTYFKVVRREAPEKPLKIRKFSRRREALNSACVVNALISALTEGVGSSVRVVQDGSGFDFPVKYRTNTSYAIQTDVLTPVSEIDPSHAEVTDLESTVSEASFGVPVVGVGCGCRPNRVHPVM